MAEVAEPAWQDNYVDLGDDGSIRFGGQCVVCDARFATVAIPIAQPMASAANADVEEQKFAAFAAFDGAYRSILIPCFRCGNSACPECWDVDKQMCGACVAERGLVRSPHRGGPVEGPLADGFLRRIEPGRFSEAGRPAWLKELLRAQADPPAARSMSSPSHTIGSLGGPPPADGQASYAADPGDSAHLRAPALPFDPGKFDTPTYKMPAAPSSAMPEPTYPDPLNGNEGAATASLITCPQCGTRNYDFVTQCGECGLQLIQVCPRCAQLNAGHAKVCEACGAPLERPSGWTSVRTPVLQLQQADARRTLADQPTPAVAMPDQPTKRPVKTSPVPLKSKRQRTNYATPMLSAQPALALAATDVGGLAAPNQHPYANAAAGSRVAATDLRRGPASAYRPSVLSGVGLVIERLLTVVLVVALLALVAVTVAAEQSPAANHWLTITLHLDVKSHIDRFVYWLQVELHISPQS